MTYQVHIWGDGHVGAGRVDANGFAEALERFTLELAERPAPVRPPSRASCSVHRLLASELKAPASDR